MATAVTVTVAAAAAAAATPQQSDATADQTSNMSDLTRDIYMRHFKSQVEAKLRSRDFQYALFQNNRRNLNIMYLMILMMLMNHFPPSLSRRQRLVQQSPLLLHIMLLLKTQVTHIMKSFKKDTL